MKRLLTGFSLIVLQVLCIQFANAQMITGKIADESGEPIYGVSVQNLRTKNGTTSGADGRYRITARLNDSLLFSHTNYENQIFKVLGSTMNTALRAKDGTMSDVVVVGYGSQRKADLTVAVDKVNIKDLNKAPVRSFDEALGGRVAGVSVTSSDGQPGASTSIIIRGNNSVTQDNSPLYIIDGFPVENNNNNVINPNDIESIEVLKDASATAIYGSRGSNGVIMITTKRGKEGPPNLQLGASWGLQKVTKFMDIMNPYDFVNYQIARDTVTTNTSNPTYLYLTRTGKNLDYYKTVPPIDWQKKVITNAPMHNYNLSLTGGSPNTKYAVTGNVLNQDGVIINSNFLRYQGKMALDQTLSKKFKAGINANYIYIRQTGIAPSQSTNSGTTNVMYSVWGYRPATGSDFDIEGSLFDADVDGSNDYRINPYISLQNLYRVNKTKSLWANAYVEYNIVPSLKLRTTFGISNYNLTNEAFNNSKTWYGSPLRPEGVNGSIFFTENNSWLNENILTYTKKIKEHNFMLTGVASEQAGKYNRYGITATQMLNESLGLSGLDEGVTQNNTATTSNWTLASFVGRVNYNFKSLYYFTASFRADGSSRFMQGRQWGYFPAVSFAWRFYNHELIKNSGIISDGKLRIGYGENGNNRVSDFGYLSTIGLPIGAAYTVINVPVRGSVPLTKGNPELTWETTQETNIGLDIWFLKNRITLTTDIYRKDTRNLLILASLPPSTGYPNAFKNVGSVRNEGIELTLNTINIKTKKLNWNSNFNIAFNRNKVLGLNEGQDFMLTTIRWDNNWQNTPAYITRVGGPIGQMYGFQWDGIYTYDDFIDNGNGTYTLKTEVPSNGNTRANMRPGDIKYKDLNGDTLINAKDLGPIGDGNPKHQGGFNNNFTYKNFDLNIFFQWSYGNDIFNINNHVFNGNALNKANLNQFASYNNRWSPENTDSEIFRAGGYFGGGYSTYIVEDGSYLRLKTVSIGYNIPRVILKRAKVKDLRVYFAAQNLITWTKYTGMDPEINTYNTALTPGFDYSPYPRAATYTFGLNLTL